MADWKNVLYRIANRGEHHFDDLLLRFREQMGWKTNVHIQNYKSFGTSSALLVKGRLLHFRDTKPVEGDNIWDNLADMYRRFNSHEIKGALLLISYRGYEAEVFTDEDGYFEKLIPLGLSENHSLWHHPKIEILQSPVAFEKPLVAEGSVMVPPDTAAFGVISDIDDTILPSHAVEILKMMYTTFTSNAYSRIPFQGVPEFYAALQKGRTGHSGNPLFYVSSSPWNLYDFIIDFFHINKIPDGAVLLKDYGFTHDKFFSDGHLGHKQKIINKILDTYPFMPFILIGDSGQKDPEIYAEIVRQHPHRILAVIIRDVSIDERCAEIQRIYESIDGSSVPMILSENTHAAFDFCVQKGFISHPPLGN